MAVVLKRGFTKKGEQEKTVFSVQYDTHDAVIEDFVKRFGAERCANMLWYGYSINDVNSTARSVENKKGDPIAHIEKTLEADFDGAFDIEYNVPKAVSDEMTTAVKKLTPEQKAQALAKLKEMGLA